MELGKVLNEISGITYNTGDHTLLAISDSKPKIIEINIIKQKLKDYTGKIVPSKTDFEDLVKADSAIYILNSNGIIYEVLAQHLDSSHIAAYSFASDEQNDFESLYYDPFANGLIMLCKTCSADKGKQVRTAYRFSLSTHKFDAAPFYTISSQEVKTVLRDDHAKFDPSAAAIHPITRQLYILSSAGNLLVITGTRGKVIEAYHLNPQNFPQAEGIAFAPNGDMYITNEGKFGSPTLLIFHYTKGKKK